MGEVIAGVGTVLTSKLEGGPFLGETNDFMVLGTSAMFAKCLLLFYLFEAFWSVFVPNEMTEIKLRHHCFYLETADFVADWIAEFRPWYS